MDSGKQLTKPPSILLSVWCMGEKVPCIRMLFSRWRGANVRQEEVDMGSLSRTAGAY